MLAKVFASSIQCHMQTVVAGVVLIQALSELMLLTDVGL